MFNNQLVLVLGEYVIVLWGAEAELASLCALFVPSPASICAQSSSVAPGNACNKQ